MLRPALLSMTALATLAACEPQDMPGQVTAPRAVSTMDVEFGNTLPQSGQGNSGGVLAVTGETPIAGVEATMAYNVGGRGAGARVDFHNGPMTGVGVRCTRAGGGATVPECTAINADSAFLVNELSGVHSYAGSFAINGYGPNDSNGFVTIHAGPGADELVQLPGASVNYSGRFQAGGSVNSGGQVYSGRATGTSEMTADFGRGTIDARLNGQMRDDRTGLTTALSAGFSDGVIDPNGRFFNTSNTTFDYAGSQAWGEVDGAFYGPNAEEAAGTFGFGNSAGGVTGIMIGCSEYNPANCIAPSPRF